MFANFHITIKLIIPLKTNVNEKKKTFKFFSELSPNELLQQEGKSPAVSKFKQLQTLSASSSIKLQIFAYTNWQE